MIRATVAAVLLGIAAWAYRASSPPPPSTCGSPGGPPITGPRIKLRDGRFLAYVEHGVPKEVANYKIILVHGFGSCRHDAPPFTHSETAKQLGVYFVTFDRPGYGESDAHPKKTLKSIALDIEDLADRLALGSRFYVMGFSMGGHSVWSCLKYIPHRLAGAVLNAPVVNYWWPGFPANLSKEAYHLQPLEDQWALRVAHYLPWLTYWWNTQPFFPFSTVIAGKAKLSPHDLQVVSKLPEYKCRGYATQQGHFESFHRDLMIGFRKWDFNPMELQNPSNESQLRVHLWHGAEDGVVPVSLQRFIAKRLPWVDYHEVSGGHLFPYDQEIGDAILKTLLLGENYQTK